MKTNFQTCNCDMNLIDVTGLCIPGDTTDVIKNTPYWRQMYISEYLEIPSNKLDIEHINSINISVSILQKKVIKTPRSYDDSGTTPVETPNLEGKLLTGRKLIIEGQLCQKIVYTSTEAAQPVHSVDFYVPFSFYIVVPKEVTFQGQNGADIVEDSFNVNFNVDSCIEDVTACVLDVRRILKQVTLLLYAVPTQSC